MKASPSNKEALFICLFQSTEVIKVMHLKYSELGLRQEKSDVVRLMSIALQKPDLLSLAAGFTDNSTLPLEDVKELVSLLDGHSAEGKSALQYGTNQGCPKLRSLLTRRIEKYDAAEVGQYNAGRMFMSNGSQQGLYLAILTLCNPGDIVLVEQPTYFVFLEILKGLGVQAIAMPMQDNGEVDIEQLETLLDNLERGQQIDRLKALYLVSYFANPSGHSISFDSKVKIADLLRSKAQHVALIEDAAYRDLYFEAPFSGGSVLCDEVGHDLSVLYSSTLTKPFASGLKIGYSFCTNDEWLDKMLIVKGQQDFGSSNFSQVIMESAISKGKFDRHLETLRKTYQSKMTTLHSALMGPLKKEGWEWEMPKGGLYLWLKAPQNLRTDFDSSFHKACLNEGVLYVPGELCAVGSESDHCVRLSYGVLGVEQLTEAARRFVSAQKELVVLM